MSTSDEEVAVTSSAQPLPQAAGVATEATRVSNDFDDAQNNETTAGTAEADVDAGRAGADTEADVPTAWPDGDGDAGETRAERDTDGTPVGQADAREDAAQAGADPDAVGS